MQNNDPLVISYNIIKALEYPEIESIIDNAFTLIKTQFNYNFVSHTWLTLLNR